MKTNKMWLFLAFLLIILSSCSTMDEKNLLEEPETNLSTSGSARALAATPMLHVGGKYLKDPCNNNVVLHGVAITPSPWFNGCQYGANSSYCTWDNYNVQGALNYNKAVMNKLSSALMAGISITSAFILTRIGPMIPDRLSLRTISQDSIITAW